MYSPARYLAAIFLLCPLSYGQESMDPNPMSGEALFADVERYAAFGEHRTASEGDVATSRWLAEELKQAGYRAELQSWRLTQFMLNRNQLIVGGRVIDSFPFWMPKPTGPDPIETPLAVMSQDTRPGALHGHIAFADSSFVTRERWSTGINDLVVQAARAGAEALVMVVATPSGEIGAINAREPNNREPLPIPALIVTQADEAFLSEAAKNEAPASLLLHGQADASAQAYNVIATLERGPRWIVVTTPTSGWFTCAGERGPGVALFLGLARWAVASESPFSYLFIGNSGHELDNLGAHHSMDAKAPGIDDVACWIHLGASIGARDWRIEDGVAIPEDSVNKQGNLVGTPDLLPILEDAFEGVEGYKPRSGEPIRGELRHFIAAGYRSFGFFGGHFYFHTPKDTPDTTSPELLEPIAKGLVNAVEALARNESGR